MALHYASDGGYHDTVRVLLERGADPNLRDKVSGVHVYVGALIMFINILTYHCTL